MQGLHESFMDRGFGREAFGIDPAGYHAARPAYPEWVFEILREHCRLASKKKVFEVGAGTGLATRRLLDLGANPLVAIEPDERLAAFLLATVRDDALTLMVSSFEDAVLPQASFDLGVSATAFHWLDEDLALRKAADLLRTGGWWAMVWNVFGDPSRADPFHEATKTLLDGPVSPSERIGHLPFALDVGARVAASNVLAASTPLSTKPARGRSISMPIKLSPLYATYSNVNIRADRARFLQSWGVSHATNSTAR